MSKSKPNLELASVKSLTKGAKSKLKPSPNMESISKCEMKGASMVGGGAILVRRQNRRRGVPYLGALPLIKVGANLRGRLYI